MAGSNTAKTASATLGGILGDETVNFTGDYVMDKFCLDPMSANTCLNMFEFFVFNNYESLLSDTMGFIGLGPKTSGTTSFVGALQAAGTVSTSTVTPVFSPLTNFTDFLDGGNQANIYFGVVKGETEGIQGKSGPTHKIDPSDGSHGWSFKLADYKFNNAKVQMSTATHIELSTQFLMMFPAMDYTMIVATMLTTLTMSQ